MSPGATNGQISCFYSRDHSADDQLINAFDQKYLAPLYFLVPAKAAWVHLSFSGLQEHVGS